MFKKKSGQMVNLDEGFLCVIFFQLFYRLELFKNEK